MGTYFRRGSSGMVRQYQEGAADVFKVHMNEENINRYLSGDGQATVKQN